MNPVKIDVIGKVVHYTNIHEAPIPQLQNEDGQKLQSMQERHQRDDGIVETTCHFRGQIHHNSEHHLGDSCNVPGIRVPKCTRWWPQRIHNETYCQVRWRMLGHRSIAARKGSDDAFDGTEEFESAWWDDSVWSNSTLIVQSSCWKLQYITGRVHLANGTVATNDSGNLWIRVHVSMSRFLKIFSVQRGTPRESDTASRREEACLLNLCNVVAEWSHHSLAQ